MSGLIIRPYRTEDAAALATVFHRAVRRGAARHYTLPQRMAWSPRPQTAEHWDTRLSRLDTMVAEDGRGLLGFMALNLDDAFLDFAYVLPEAAGRGVGGTLLAVLEGRAKSAGIDRLETEASRVAEPFFAARGWSVLRRQRVRRHGIGLPNAVMEKPLVAAEVAA
ncbi:GNAT family N-acetyltransferase [Maritalea mobilis]|uniref:GNAT family N-acetyltransferase n=1 Tax=Maritalea mobilis TaxID=483324 RepID=UPI001C94829B|nr:GNAT family N-acetyltransferase [Maritalea mobilis]MBY6200730.1 GNAT family N-acetyltransferase [Maritalea mobilis]